MHRRQIGLGLGLALLLGGCSTLDTRPTVEQLTNARVAVETAEKLDAKTYAPDELRRAQDALAIAKDSYAGESFDRAFDFAKKATIYALVAKARTEQKKSQEKLTAAKAELEKVKAQTETIMKNAPQPVVQSAPPAAAGNTQTPTAVPEVQKGVQP